MKDYISYEDTLGIDKSSHIIIDLGHKYTKIGMGLDTEPRKILKTPHFFNYDKFLKDDTVKFLESKDQISSMTADLAERLKYENRNYSILYYKNQLSDIKFKIEEFMTYIFGNVLQLKKQQRDKNYICLLMIDLFMAKALYDIYEYFVKIILDSPLIHSVRIIPKFITTIYATGYSSGIVIDCGYLHTSIVALNNGFPFLKKIKKQQIGSCELERRLKRFIMEDNLSNPKSKLKSANMMQFNSQITPILDDLLVRGAICVPRKISKLLKNPVEEAKIKNDSSKIDYYKDVPDFNLSFLSRIKLGEQLFGEVENEEYNLAYELIRLIQTIPNEDRKKLCQNIILSGGTTMFQGFFRRLVEEIQYIITEEEEFKDLLPLKEFIKIHKAIFPRNCTSWIGASLICNFDKIELQKFAITKEEMDNYLTKNEPNPINKILAYFNLNY
jgi:actin-related protein